MGAEGRATEPAHVAPVDPAGLYAARPGTSAALDRHRALFIGDDGERAELATDEAAVLGACATFATRAAHLELMTKRNGWPREAVERAFARLVERGLIAAVPAYIRTGGRIDAPLDPPTIVVRSYQRPEGLANVLDGLAALESKRGAAQPGRRFAIVDDSFDRAFIDRTRALVREFAGKVEAPVALIDESNRDALIEALFADVPQAERRACRCLLDPNEPSAVTGSRTWNWAVLLGAGGPLGILDDDTGFPIRRFAETRTQVDLLDASEPIARWFDAMPGDAELPPLDADPYDELRQLVGRTPASLVGEFGYDARYLPHRSARELKRFDATHRILGAIPGTYGTIPLDSSAYLAYLEPGTQGHLWREPYRHERLSATNVAQGYDAPRVISTPLYTPLLLDDRELMPFAGTWGRVDDTYFLLLTNAIVADAAWLHVPMLLGHHDYSRRDRLARAVEPLKLDRNAFVANVFSEIGTGLRSPDRAKRLATVGLACGDLAESHDDDLADAVLRWRAGMFARLTAHLSGALARHPEAPAAWREHVERVVDANVKQALRDRVDEDETAFVRTALVQVANASRQWPAIWQRARDSGLYDTVLAAHQQ